LNYKNLFRSPVGIALIAAMTSYAGSAISSPAIADNGRSTPVTISANGDLDVPLDQIPRLEMIALTGSGTAAHKLARYYFYAKNDRASGMYWETIAAENGNFSAMKALSVHLAAEQSPQSDIRARYWSKRATMWARTAARCEKH
jgi:hypothetical protein